MLFGAATPCEEDPTVRALLSITTAAVLLASAAFAPATAQDATKPALANDPNVQQSQQPDPNAQGVRTPKPLDTANQMAELNEALAAVRRAPPNLEGTPVPRPNELASEPDQPNEPTRSPNPSDLSSRDNVQGK